MFQDHQWASARPFNNQYRCYSISMFPGKERAHIEKGGKVIMPPSALDQLSQLNISYPMLFKLTNGQTERVTHCGVLEFVAEEGKLYMPHWMMQNLLLQEGDLVRVETATLPRATFSKFQPLSVGFLEVTNPKAVLENALRNYACLTAGDVIAIHYNDLVYEISVLETKPEPAVSIIECDMNVDFAPPLGYTEDLKKIEPGGRTAASGGGAGASAVADPASASRRTRTVSVPEDDGGVSMDSPRGDFQAFTGQGQRLDGRGVGASKKRDPVGAAMAAGGSKTPGAAKDSQKNKPDAEIKPDAGKKVAVGIPDFNYKVGKLTFLPGVKLDYNSDRDKDNGAGSFSPFGGAGRTLRPS